MSDLLLEVPFLGGIDQAAREEFVDPAKSFVVLHNVRQERRGGASKRLGYEPMSTARIDGTARSSGRRIFGHGDKLCTVDGDVLDVRSSTLGVAVAKGAMPEAAYRLVDLPSVGTRSDVSDVLISNGLAVVTWLVRLGGVSTSVYLFAAVIDPADGTFVRGPEVVNFGGDAFEGARLASYGTTVLAFGADPSSKVLSVHALNMANVAAGWGSGVVLANDYKSSLSVSSGTGAAFVSYVNDGTADATSRVTVAKATSSGVSTQVRLGTSSTEPAKTDVSDNGQALWVVFNVGVDVKATCLDPANIVGAPIGTVAGVVTLPALETLTFASVVETEPGKAAILLGVGARAMVRWLQVADGGVGAPGPGGSVFGVRPMGRAFHRDGKLFAPFSSEHDRAEVVLCDWTPPTTGDPAAVVLYLRPVASPLVRGLFAGATRTCRTAQVTSSTYWFGFTIQKTGVSNGSTIAEFDFAAPSRWQPCELGGWTHLSGGVTTIFDGISRFESGFLTRPSKPELDTSSSGGLTFTKGGRRYVAVYEHIDASGNRHISGVSDPSDLTGNIASKYVALSTTPIAMTMRESTRVVFYATLDGGEPPYHRVVTVTVGFTSAVDLTSVPNDPSEAAIVFADTLQEADLAKQELLLGTGNLPGTVVGGAPGGPQDHRAPPGLSWLTPYNGMLVGASGSELWWSAEVVYGEGMWHSPIFSLSIGEPITGLAVMDGTLFIFTARSIYAVSGGPPNDTGTDAGIGTPHRLSVDFGCVNGDSIVTTALGTFFQSPRGIELLSRGQSVEPIGESVRDELEAFPVVTSAVLDEKHGLVRLSLAASRGADGLVSGGGRDLVFDLARGTWVSSDRKFGAEADQASQHAAMCVVGGARRYCWLAADGVVYAERDAGDASAHLDGSTWVTMRAETACVHLAGLQGEQVIERILHLATRHTDHGLTRSVFRDYLGSDPEVTSWTYDELAELPKQWLDKELATSRGQSVRVVLEDAAPVGGAVGNGKGATWICLSFVGQMHRGPRRTSYGERGG